MSLDRASVARGHLKKDGPAPRPGIAHTLTSQREVLALQRVIGNQAIQRLLGARGTNQVGANVPITFDQVFVRKHIAADVPEAKRKTFDRIDNDPLTLQTMKDGKLGNTVATEDAWRAAINASREQMPPENEWTPNDDTEAPERYDNVRVFVSGLDVKRDGPKARTATAQDLTNTPRSIGGYWTVANNNVAVDVDHASSK